MIDHGTPPRPVALVITDLDVGGAERALVALATGLDRARFAPSVIALGPEAALAAPLRAAGIEVSCLGVDRRRPIAAVRALARVLRRTRPAIVQSFLFHANVAARFAARLAGVGPVVGGLRVAERGVGWHARLDRLTSRLSVGSVCVSEGVRRHAIGLGLQRPERLWVIPNGVDPGPIDAASPIPRADLGVPIDAPLLVFVGRMERQKGVDDLLAAVRLLGGHRDWRLLMVGDGPLRGRCEGESSVDARLSGRVRWLGRRSDVPSLLKAADALILPSHWEGMPNVVLEAMAAGLAVIATRVEGSEDLVLPGRTGWLVPRSAPDHLAAAIESAIDDLPALARLGVAGRARVLAEYSPIAVVDRYQTLWSAILDGPMPAPS